MTLEEIGSRAKAVSRTLNNLGSREKNIGLEEAARALLEGEEEILAANQADYEKAEKLKLNLKISEGGVLSAQPLFYRSWSCGVRRKL